MSNISCLKYCYFSDHAYKNPTGGGGGGGGEEGYPVHFSGGGVPLVF